MSFEREMMVGEEESFFTSSNFHSYIITSREHSTKTERAIQSAINFRRAKLIGCDRESSKNTNFNCTRGICSRRARPTNEINFQLINLPLDDNYKVSWKTWNFLLLFLLGLILPSSSSLSRFTFNYHTRAELRHRGQCRWLISTIKPRLMVSKVSWKTRPLSSIFRKFYTRASSSILS